MTFIKGHTPWNNGLKMSEETKLKVSKAKKGNTKPNSGSFKKGAVSPNKGRKLEWMIGENNTNFGKFGKEHPCWKDEKKQTFVKQIRGLFKYRQWRSDIFTRDNFTCVFCGERGIELNADHYPKRFIDIVNEYKIETLDEANSCEELWNMNNGRTLCVNCHRETDTWGKQKVI